MKILVPTDFSECASSAAKTAMDIGLLSKGELYFMHLLGDLPGPAHKTIHGGKTKPVHSTEEGIAKASLDQLVAEAERQGLKAHAELVFGQSGDEIWKYVKSLGIELIVMGSHGATGIRETFIGSNTQRVVRNAVVPVLVIKKRTKKFSVNQIVFASGFSEDVSKPLAWLSGFASLLKAKIHLLFVNLPYHFIETDEAMRSMKPLIAKIPGATANIFNAMQEESGIEKFSDQINADMIALITHGRKGFMKMLAPSIAESLVNHGTTPVLVINKKTGKS